MQDGEVKAKVLERNTNAPIPKVNNIVVFIRFSDSQYFGSRSFYEGFLNTNEYSMRNYFSEVSYGRTEVNSYFHWSTSEILAYTDSYPRS
ncbi:MAG: hypothetical protein LBB91_02005 [Clostridiales bacterium]|jgi:hypothetical protein|nr:hypothetical protein [Clostridiales bacterium]